MYLASQVAKNLKPKDLSLYLHNGVFVAESQCVHTHRFTFNCIMELQTVFLDLRSHEMDRLLLRK